MLLPGEEGHSPCSLPEDGRYGWQGWKKQSLDCFIVRRSEEVRMQGKGEPAFERKRGLRKGRSVRRSVLDGEYVVETEEIRHANLCG